MKYAWDRLKYQKNLEQHQLDFNDAWRVYEHPDKVTINDPHPHEERFRALAEVDGVVRLLVYTMRVNEKGDEVVRCISFRTAKRKERKLYYETIQDS